MGKATVRMGEKAMQAIRARGTARAKQRSEWLKKQCKPAPRKLHRKGKATVKMGEKQCKSAPSPLSVFPIPQ
ncbi:MAG: hypothetical protein RSC40_07830 [Clostridia bacterium]